MLEAPYVKSVASADSPPTQANHSAKQPITERHEGSTKIE